MERLCGAQTAVSLHSAVDGPCGLDLHLVLDAHSVFAAVTAQEISTPTERQLIYGVRALREHLEARRLRTIHRVDTRDMLCDALTKGGVTRSAILDAFSSGEWKILVREQLHSWTCPDRLTRISE